VDIVASASHTCAKFGNGQVGCLGVNWSGEVVGNFETVPSSTFGASFIQDLDQAPVLMAAGTRNVCVVSESGGVECWGNNQTGMLGGLTSNDSESTPQAIQTSAMAVAISASEGFGCVLTENQTVECWGDNGHGQLGRSVGAPEPTHQPAPVDFGTLGTPASVSAGTTHACSRLAPPSGEVVCWGSNAQGQVTGTAAAENLAPVAVAVPALGAEMDPLQSVAVGGDHGCALAGAGDVWCWGANDQGQLGVSGAQIAPVQVPDLRAAAVFADQGVSCARTEAGALLCWGITLLASTVAPSLVLDGPVRRFAVGTGYRIALLETGDLVSWGTNYKMLWRTPSAPAEPRPCCLDFEP
jgi:alpha-tubulin suppressor-like RCC1 family protein